jgi:hypothetical protein
MIKEVMFDIMAYSFVYGYGRYMWEIVWEISTARVHERRMASIVLTYCFAANPKSDNT